MSLDGSGVNTLDSPSSNCEDLQSVGDLLLDVTDILWVFDGGSVNALDDPISRYEIVGFNIRTKRW